MGGYCWDFDSWILERQIVGVLIVKFPEHQQKNVNLQKGRSGSGGLAAFPMIKLVKSTEREKRT